jgi:hypothetical protein
MIGRRNSSQITKPFPKSGLAQGLFKAAAV